VYVTHGECESQLWRFYGDVMSCTTCTDDRIIGRAHVVQQTVTPKALTLYSRPGNLVWVENIG